MKKNIRCCFCGKDCETPLGNNPEPFFENDPKAGCCNDCDALLVIPARRGEIAVIKDAHGNAVGYGGFDLANGLDFSATIQEGNSR